MKFRNTLVGALVFALLFALPAQASTANCGQLNRNLKLGVSGEDVRVLQQILNADTRTMIAVSGSGSAGNESTYFGAKTKLAIIKFQELYRNEVLTPAGLTKGNGYVGALSRAKLAALCKASGGTQSSPASTPTSETKPSTSPALTIPSSKTLNTSIPVQNVKPYLMYPEKYAVRQGGKLVIYGGGFTETNNAVFVGTKRYGGLAPTAMKTLEVVIPTSAPLGKFDLKFSNAKGESNSSFVIITDANAAAPVVTEFTPTTGVSGTKVTIKGKNFSKDWNDIVIDSKTVRAKSPDGTTLTFVATLPLGADSPTDSSDSVTLPLWFYVLNANGLSESSVFNIKF